MKKCKVAILGSTGSVGTQALDVIRENPNYYQVRALAAHSNVEVLATQIIEFSPSHVRLKDSEQADKLKKLLEVNEKVDLPKILVGESGLTEIVTDDEVDTVICAITGFAAFPSLVQAIKARKSIVLANKESLIVGGGFLRDLLKEYPVKFIPVDSEHNSIYQCLGARPNDIPSRVMITASGGPFLNYTFQELQNVTPEQAVKHPKWEMGAKISVDSATLMNKGLEVIEALELFSFPVDTMEVLVHPQHVIHAIVEYSDAAAFALMYDPDMRVPISHALRCCYHSNLESNEICCEREKLDFRRYSKLDFFEPDLQRFPCLKLALDAFKLGGDAKIILNWANEIAVEMFLKKRIKFMQIPEIIEKALKLAKPHQKLSNLDDIYLAQSNAEEVVKNITLQF